VFPVGRVERYTVDFYEGVIWSWTGKRVIVRKHSAGLFWIGRWSRAEECGHCGRESL